LHPPYYRGCWHGVSRCLFLKYIQNYSFRKGLYNLATFFAHAVSLRQGFPHCEIFFTAASRRSMDRVSVPFWLVILSDQLPVIDLVSRYLANYLIGRRPLPNRKIFTLSGLSGINPYFYGVSLSSGQVPTYYSAVRRSPTLSSTEMF
jgi:hypothetical protein